MLVEETDIRFAANKPQQLEGDLPEMHALGGQKRETLGQVKAGLRPKIGDCADPGPIFFGFAFFKN